MKKSGASEIKGGIIFISNLNKNPRIIERGFMIYCHFLQPMAHRSLPEGHLPAPGCGVAASLATCLWEVAAEHGLERDTVGELRDASG